MSPTNAGMSTTNADVTKKDKKTSKDKLHKKKDKKNKKDKLDKKKDKKKKDKKEKKRKASELVQGESQEPSD